MGRAGFGITAGGPVEFSEGGTAVLTICTQVTPPIVESDGHTGIARDQIPRRRLYRLSFAAAVADRTCRHPVHNVSASPSPFVKLECSEESAPGKRSPQHPGTDPIAGNCGAGQCLPDKPFVGAGSAVHDCHPFESGAGATASHQLTDDHPNFGIGGRRTHHRRVPQWLEPEVDGSTDTLVTLPPQAGNNLLRGRIGGAVSGGTNNDHHPSNGGQGGDETLLPECVHRAEPTSRKPSPRNFPTGSERQPL